MKVDDAVIHALKERKGNKELKTQCGAEAEPAETTVWWTDVTCPVCQAVQNSRRERINPPPQPRVGS